MFEKRADSEKKFRKPEEIRAWVLSNKDAFATQMDAKRKEFEAAGSLADAGERYAALKAFERGLMPIQLEAVTEMADALSRRHEKMQKVQLGVLGALLTPLFGIGILFYRDMKLEAEENGLVERQGLVKAAADETGFFKPLDDLKRDVARLQDATLKENMQGIVLSPIFDDLYDRFPEVKDAFVRATAKQQARDMAGLQLGKPSLKAPEASKP